MIPSKGQYIIIYLRNGIQLEGEVILWSDNKSSLTSKNGTAIIVLQKTLEDVLFFKITNVKDNYEKLVEKPAKEEDDIKRLAELKNEINALDRTELREKMSSHQADGLKEVQYGLPLSSIKISGTVKRPGAQTPRTDFEFCSELQNLFPEKRKGNRTSS